MRWKVKASDRATYDFLNEFFTRTDTTVRVRLPKDRHLIFSIEDPGETILLTLGYMTGVELDEDRPIHLVEVG